MTVIIGLVITIGAWVLALIFASVETILTMYVLTIPLMVLLLAWCAEQVKHL